MVAAYSIAPCLNDRAEKLRANPRTYPHRTTPCAALTAVAAVDAPDSASIWSNASTARLSHMNTASRGANPHETTNAPSTTRRHSLRPGARTHSHRPWNHRARCFAKSETENGDCSCMHPCVHRNDTPRSATRRAKYVSSVMLPAMPWSNPTSRSIALCTAQYDPCMPMSGWRKSRY